jgi:hypothetical protein
MTGKKVAIYNKAVCCYAGPNVLLPTHFMKNSQNMSWRTVTGIVVLIIVAAVIYDLQEEKMVSLSDLTASTSTGGCSVHTVSCDEAKVKKKTKRYVGSGTGPTAPKAEEAAERDAFNNIPAADRTAFAKNMKRALDDACSAQRDCGPSTTATVNCPTSLPPPGGSDSRIRSHCTVISRSTNAADRPVREVRCSWEISCTLACSLDECPDKYCRKTVNGVPDYTDAQVNYDEGCMTWASNNVPDEDECNDDCMGGGMDNELIFKPEATTPHSICKSFRECMVDPMASTEELYGETGVGDMGGMTP